MALSELDQSGNIWGGGGNGKDMKQKKLYNKYYYFISYLIVVHTLTDKRSDCPFFMRKWQGKKVWPYLGHCISYSILCHERGGGGVKRRTFRWRIWRKGTNHEPNNLKLQTNNKKAQINFVGWQHTKVDTTNKQSQGQSLLQHLMWIKGQEFSDNPPAGFLLLGKMMTFASCPYLPKT